MKRDDVFYQAMLARDYRFDGKFFIGVKTTGIYCRPICPAKPKRENVEFFLEINAAEKAGYRPCLRCRPESAPLSPAWFGKSAVVQRALRAISTEIFFDDNEDQFAEKFGITARHLRRLFTEEVGLTPKQIAFNNRLNFARKLITESKLPLISVAMTSGFSSVRRFNDAFKKRFKRTPTDLRKKQENLKDKSSVSLTLSYRPPFDWNQLLEFYRNHQIIGVEVVTESTYERSFKLGEISGSFKVLHNPDKSQLILDVSVDDPSVLLTVAARVRKMFDLDSDPLLIANSFQQDKFLNSLWKKNPGLRVARGWDAYEMSICTILGQLVSLKQARTLVKQLVENYGEQLPNGNYLFPTIKTLSSSDLSSVRTSEARKKSIREFSKKVLSGSIDLHFPEMADISREKLLEVSGIGPWSAEYILLRALGETDALPKTDLILKRALQKHPKLDLEATRPWRSYVAIYLWNKYAGKGNTL